MLSDAYIGRLWAKHFPRRHDDQDSCQVCYGMCTIVKYKADLVREATYAESINRALKAAGIRIEEFAQVNAERARGLDSFA